MAVEIDSLGALKREVFGPVVHLLTYRARDLDAVVAGINALGYGLTLGIHTRIDGLAQRIARELRVGNVYINRNMIGAVVGVQPFGGMGLSGTGPKAGGPHYLHRLATEQTITTNTAAIGGNAGLLSLAAR
jgi:RHH-type proline utilization regulon transcriptional repressor/proline dehydrogenase/delta 1-pyrroline-5-carboxylate dehydrogenase